MNIKTAQVQYEEETQPYVSETSHSNLLNVAISHVEVTILDFRGR